MHGGAAVPGSRAQCTWKRCAARVPVMRQNGAGGSTALEPVELGEVAALAWDEGCKAAHTPHAAPLAGVNINKNFRDFQW